MLAETTRPAAVRDTAPRLGFLRSWDTAIIIAVLLSIAVASATVTGFASPRNTGFLLIDLIPILLLALPMTLIILTGEIDLSVASVAGFVSCVFGSLWGAGLSLELIIPLCIVLGAVSGAVNGVLVSVLGLPSLAVTIGTLALYRGLAFVVLGDQAVTSFPRAITSGLQAKIGASGIPVWIIPVVILAIIFGVVLHFTGFGRSLSAIGYSEEAARFAGIRVAQTKFWLFIISGAVAALVGIWWTLRYGSARGDNATGLELSVIAAVLLGGVSIFGGKGNLPGVIAGVVLLGILRNALQLARVPEDTLSMLTGGLLILAVVAPNAIAWSRTLSRRSSTP
ncbi:putative ABC transporter permease protein [Arthrobacter globiformis NBRC 12137]|uniref:Autoinducer 2 import system permease protein LsrD n=1 Tax=Arthrobacter globiformis (strain ATCC 8010 / DSM 20124 / JCM 1332 / NBRC 12137 / NCIMB 8907 / NRRL B-2979 / 168) TaxID=1077972 RepID=H0QTU2_ARTG1|nr:ABC transporter permease [Arthrobacter globiformis]GAB16243.1 putative ABC transporter permease protein [Arthrobacter globiformis NBRC 12137]